MAPSSFRHAVARRRRRKMSTYSKRLPRRTIGSIAVTVTASTIGLLGKRRNPLWLAVFMIVVAVHWVEHLVQVAQIHLMGTPVPQALGVLGEVWPDLVSSEWLHFTYNLAVLVGAALLLRLFGGPVRRWWAVGVWAQVWHFFEHGLLFAQVQGGFTLFGAETQSSVVQLLIPRVELHLFYNAIVTLLLGVALAQRKRKDVTPSADPYVKT